jgi:hypothetical protein
MQGKGTRKQEKQRQEQKQLQRQRLNIAVGGFERVQNPFKVEVVWIQGSGPGVHSGLGKPSEGTHPPPPYFGLKFL